MFLQAITLLKLVSTRSSKQRIKTGARKIKAIQAVLAIFTHIPAYSGMFRDNKTYSGIMRHIKELFRPIQVYSEPCVTLAYSESWHTQNQRRIFWVKTLRKIFREKS